MKFSGSKSLLQLALLRRREQNPAASLRRNLSVGLSSEELRGLHAGAIGWISAFSTTGSIIVSFVTSLLARRICMWSLASRSR
ncbi:hypothetical protein BJV78DRAFT_1230875 [Lactifluus subvellereus]|nr:hypothetical protein BJV78DRAFT_1230875 [Lactifluus subvellereus]